MCLVTFTPRGQVFISPSHPHTAYSAPPHHIAAATGHWFIGHVLVHSPKITQPYSRPPNLAQDPSGVNFRLTPSRGATVLLNPAALDKTQSIKIHAEAMGNQSCSPLLHVPHLAHTHTTLTAVRGHASTGFSLSLSASVCFSPPPT